MGLDLDQMRKLAALVRQEVENKGAFFFSWVNPPVIEGERITHSSGSGAELQTCYISLEEAMGIYKAKLDGVYAERLVLAICTAIAAVKAGKDVAILQIQDEPHAPFDARGWLVLAIEGHPIFHCSPSDLPVNQAIEAGLVTEVGKGSAEAERYAWKSRTKVDDLHFLIDLMF
jgi:hypothetical protein